MGRIQIRRCKAALTFYASVVLSARIDRKRMHGQHHAELGIAGAHALAGFRRMPQGHGLYPRVHLCEQAEAQRFPACVRRAHD